MNKGTIWTVLGVIAAIVIAWVLVDVVFSVLWFIAKAVIVLRRRRRRVLRAAQSVLQPLRFGRLTPPHRGPGSARLSPWNQCCFPLPRESTLVSAGIPGSMSGREFSRSPRNSSPSTRASTAASVHVDYETPAHVRASRAARGDGIRQSPAADHQGGELPHRDGGGGGRCRRADRARHPRPAARRRHDARDAPALPSHRRGNRPGASRALDPRAGRSRGRRPGSAREARARAAGHRAATRAGWPTAGCTTACRTSRGMPGSSRSRTAASRSADSGHRASGRLPAARASSSASHARALPSDGARQSPRGDSDPAGDTFGPFGIADRLNCANAK